MFGDSFNPFLTIRGPLRSPLRRETSSSTRLPGNRTEMAGLTRWEPSSDRSVDPNRSVSLQQYKFSISLLHTEVICAEEKNLKNANYCSYRLTLNNSSSSFDIPKNCIKLMFLQHLASVLNMFVVIFLIFHFKFFQDSEQPIPFTAFRATANVRYMCI